jgi:hypothetical protein
MWIRIVSNGYSCEYDNEASGFIKGGELLDQISNYKLPLKLVYTRSQTHSQSPNAIFEQTMDNVQRKFSHKKICVVCFQQRRLIIFLK